MKFNGNPSSGSRVVPCAQTDGKTDGNDEAKSPFSQFYERAQGSSAAGPQGFSSCYYEPASAVLL